MPGERRKLLHLDIYDEKFEWELLSTRTLNRNDKVKPPKIELGELQKDTIDLLVRLQHHLADSMILADIGLNKLLLDNGDSKNLREDFDHLKTRCNQELQTLTRILGQQLYKVLFSGETFLSDALNLKDDEILRVELEFHGKNAQLLSSWPWEYMHTPSSEARGEPGRFLALEPQLVMNRRKFFKNDDDFRTETPKMLLVVSGPQGLGPVGNRAMPEGGKVEYPSTALDAIHNLACEKIIDLNAKLIEPPFKIDARYTPVASWKNFKQAVIDCKPNIIHFIGHGQRRDDGTSQLAFVGPDGKSDWRDAEQFAKAAKTNNKNLKLVFLQACESASLDPHSPMSGVARQLVNREVPAVVAMQAKIENEIANVFASRFYEELGKGESVDWAVRVGREALREELEDERSLAFGVPVLYLISPDGLIDMKNVDRGGRVPQSDSGALRDESRTANGGATQPPQRCTQCMAFLSSGQIFCSQCGTKVIPDPGADVYTAQREEKPEPYRGEAESGDLNPNPPWNYR